MKCLSIENFSILGLVLVAASVVTEAIIPSKAPIRDELGKQQFTNTPSPDCNQQITCVPGSDADCNVTAGTVTTASGITSLPRFSSASKHSSISNC